MHHPGTSKRRTTVRMGATGIALLIPESPVGAAMGLRILVVEDDEEIADFVVRGLREEGFVVEHAADGEGGWHALRNGPWDVVVLDWWLPGQDGLTLLRKFRQAGDESPVLFLTA